MNRLENEKSPYLLQHKNNPVNWYAWGDEAFGIAAAEDKPVFLSIGYSTCHWCHVMAHETFEAEDAANILNQYFISIKVDREERPDIDNIYMSACQAFTGSGGWPLSVFLDKEKRPFFAGTYYPKENFKNLLLLIADLWQNERQKLVLQAKQVAGMIKREHKITGYTSVKNAAKAALEYLSDNFDRVYGGFSLQPKFPSPQNLLFLKSHYIANRDQNALNMCATTLKAMRSGGIYDHIGGGFSRYSTDSKWLVPHFEKMLYDNALLLMTYAEMYGVTKDPFYAETAIGVAAYLLRDMAYPSGAFFTAEDADSEGHEGLFYTFTLAEIRDILKDSADEFSGYFNITERGNFEGRNILNTIGKRIPRERKEFVLACLDKLFAYREKRIRPHRDEKILTSLNGLAIAAFSVAGKLLENPEYISVAAKTAEFIDNLSDASGGLLSSYYDAPGKIAAFAEDYAFYIWGLIELFNATGDVKFIERATRLQDKFSEDFFDFDKGGFYLYGKNEEELIVRAKELYDGATPSYNSVSLHNLLAIYNHTKDIKYIEQLVKTVKHFSDAIAGYPQAYVHSVAALAALEKELPDIHVCTGNVCRPAAKNIDELISYFE